jgi:hypothetical protein
MVRSRFKWKVMLVLCVALLICGMTTMAIAQVRPTNPTMDYVPQNVGIYDTYYGTATTGFLEPDCRACHGTTTENRHHSTPWAHGDDCFYCHRQYPNIVPAVRDCKKCHIDNSTEMTVCSVTTWVGCTTSADCPSGESCVPGDFGFPHHKSDLADSGQCTQCHDPNLLSETYTIEPPNKPVGDKTPSPVSCENCHWPSDTGTDAWGRVVGATYPDQLGSETDEFRTDWLGLGGLLGNYGWSGSPKPTTGMDGNPHPQPIYANGPMATGILWDGTQDVFGLGLGEVFGDGIGNDNGICEAGETCAMKNRFGVAIPGKPFVPSMGTHHAVMGLVVPKCYFCHATAPGLPIDTDAFKQANIKACENCHDIYSLHGIPEHVCTGGGLDATGWNPCLTGTLFGGYTIAGARQQIVYAEAGYGKSEKCAACHSNLEPTEPPPPAPADMVEAKPLQPDIGSKGIRVVINPVHSGEILGDGIGNENGICEENEACLGFGFKGPGDAVKMGQKVEVITDLCGNDNGICDPGEEFNGISDPKEPKDGRGNDNCICEPKTCNGGSRNGLWCLNSTECPGGACSNPGADVTVTSDFNYHVDCAPGCRWDFITVAPYSWSDDQIEFIVPGGGELDALHNTTLRVLVVKQYDLNPITPEHTTQVKTFNLHDHPQIFNLNPASGGYGEEVTITGQGFGTIYAGIGNEILGDGVGDDDGLCETGENCYMWRTYVELHTENDAYRVTRYENTTGWTLNPLAVWHDDHIKVKLDELLDTKTDMRLIDLAQLYGGQWNVKVITDYFKDDGDQKYLLPGEEKPHCSDPGVETCDAVAGCSLADYAKGGCWGNGRIDPGDTLIYREISNDETFTVQADPAILCVRPQYVPEKNTVMIYGANFGPKRCADCYVQLCTVPYLGFCRNINNIWSNTRIKALIPDLSGPAGAKRNAYVHVVLARGTCSSTTTQKCTADAQCPGTETCNGEVTSNTYPIQITLTP